MPASQNSNKINGLVSKMPFKPATPAPGQGVLDLGIQKQVEINGIGMGVLSDGTAFLSGRGLARLCGVGHRVIQDLSSEWISGQSFARVTNVKAILDAHGLPSAAPYLEIRQGNRL
ncbi:hypothetical protein PQQ64_12675 [Paraburkholderia graminis]|uniref:hypothetical protein n=1 Tax=Paraburkholderia graminis TaxID=60548 RepID=UPI0038BCA569